jgi:hypothetical protein
MARDHRLPPSAACLSASMRDLGYSLETAIADLVDNSISADATTIEIICELAGEHPYLAIVDNCRGMAPDEVVAAMRHGSSSPKGKRGPHDLGRIALVEEPALLDMLMDQLPWRAVRIFDDGAERRGMRQVRVTAKRGQALQRISVRNAIVLTGLDD